MLRNIEESIHDSYRLCFQNDARYNIRSVCDTKNAYSPDCVEDNVELSIACVAMLDMCLKSEKEYPMSFWVELIRCIEYDDMELKSNMSSSRIFNAFIGYMTHFNRKYGDAMPRVALSSYQMHRAARFSCSRLNNDCELIGRMFKTRILIEYEDESDEDPFSEGELHHSCDLRFLDDL